MGWVFKVGKKWQITIRKLGPVLDIEPGDFVEFVLLEGKSFKAVMVRKKL